MSDYIYGQNDNYSNYTEIKKTEGTIYVKTVEPGDSTYTYPGVSYTPKTKKKKSLTVGTAIVLCVVCILLSCGAGFAGAYLFSGTTNQENNTTNPVNNSTSAEVNVTKAVKESQIKYDPSKELTIPQIVDEVADSVVEITTEYQVVSSIYQYVTSGAGSGVILTKDGYIITNNHVIYNSENKKLADAITVKLHSGEEYIAKVIGHDEDADIAVIKIEATNLTCAEVGDSKEISVGEGVVIIGNPLGSLGGTVTSGIISALDRQINVEGNRMNLLQTDAAVNPGNSGGAMFNMQGKLIGIVNAKSSSTNVEGIGFAIPINDAYDVFCQLIEYGYVRGRAYIGASFADITSSMLARYYFNSNSTGVYITDVFEGYNDKALKYGDRIITFDGVEITQYSQIKNILKNHKVGDEIEISIMRSGSVEKVTVTCFERKPDGLNYEVN